MRFRSLAMGICVFAASFTIAQAPHPDLARDPFEDIQAAEPATAAAPQPADFATEEPAQRSRPTAIGTNGAFGIVQSSPNITATLGTADNTSGFTVFSSTDLARLYVGGDGNVGIGTSTPGYVLDVHRNVLSAAFMRISNSDPGTAAATSAVGIRFTEGTTLKGHIAVVGSASTSSANGVNSLNIVNYQDAPITLGTTGVERMRVFGNGRVAIGSVNDATAQLYVHHTTAGGYGIAVNANETISANVTQDDVGLYAATSETISANVRNNGTAYGARMRSWAFGAGSLNASYGATIESGVQATATTQVDTSTGAYIHVSSGGGTIGTGYGLYVADVQATNDYGVYQAGVNDTNFFGGNTSIGLVGSTAKLYVHDTAQLPRMILAGTEFFQPANGTSTDGIGLYVGTNRANNRQLWISDSIGTAPFLRIVPTTTSTTIDAISRDGSTPTTLTVGVNGNVALTSGTGRVGIGTASPDPSYKLHVIGNAHFQGTVTGTNIRATYQDVAEWVPSTTDLEPGTVVVLNTTRNNEVMASHGAYDTRVAGVVSAQPGLSLGLEGDGKEQIATFGRVKVKVDARQTPIAVGDLLVTSEIPGTAMRSVPMDINGRTFHQPGTIIGKALEPLQDGIGEILVLLSMQ